jgi:hypothetical protein
MGSSETQGEDRGEGANQRRNRSFNNGDSYTCPICRCGQITNLMLMDAFACNFCRHIFTANLEAQTIRVEDSSQPMTWRWNGRNWQVARLIDHSLSALIWTIGGFLIIFPSSLVGLSAYFFPPLEGSAWASFPLVWLGLTVTSHFLMVAWLLLEHYQVPIYVSGKIRLQDWLRR